MDSEITKFNSGVHNLDPDEVIPKDAAQDAKNFVTKGGRNVLVYGRQLVGQDGLLGRIYALHFGYKRDGTKVHWRKSGTKIQYLNGSTWTDVVTGLTETAEYTFSNYASLSGSFTYATGIDGIYKFNNAFPANYLSMYDPLKNDKGYSLIDKARMIMWNCQNASKTTLKLSKIDPQNSGVYIPATRETFGTGDGATKTFAGVVANKNADPRNFFALLVTGPTGAPITVTNIAKASITTVTAAGHGLSAGDYVYFAGVVGMTEINGLTGQIRAVLDANTFDVFINSTTFTNYASGGTVRKSEVFTDNGMGILTSPAGGTGTFNYITGAYSVTFFVAPVNTLLVQGTYQYDNSNNGGITDFTFSATRIAAEGNIITQDIGGDKIVTVLIGPDKAYYSLKEQSSYRLALSADDTSFDNNVYRMTLGIPFLRGGVSTSQGIVFINTANKEFPELNRLEKNQFNDSVDAQVHFKHFDFSIFNYDDVCVDTYDTYVIIACKSSADATNNDRILLCNIAEKTVDIIAYGARMFSKDAGHLYVGSPITYNVYEIFSGFDDDSDPIEAFWTSRGEQYSDPQRPNTLKETLKKFRKLRFKGSIDPAQNVGIYADYDDAGFQLVGTIRGDGSYVDYNSPQVIGGHMIGEGVIGGDTGTIAYPYFLEIKMTSQPKFRKRTIKLIPEEIGYFDVEYECDHDILVFEQRIPKRFRQKQNVSLDGSQVDQ